MTTYAWFASAPDKAAHLAESGATNPRPLCDLVTAPLKPVSRHAKLCARCLTLAARRGLALLPTPLGVSRTPDPAP